MVPYIRIDALLGRITIQPFGLLVAAGVGVGIRLAMRRAQWRDLDAANLTSVISWFLIPGFVPRPRADRRRGNVIR